MNRTSLLAAMSLAALILPASAAHAQGAGKPELAKARQTAETVCAACHGADGNSTASVNPNLAGQGAGLQLRLERGLVPELPAVRGRCARGRTDRGGIDDGGGLVRVVPCG